MERWLALFLALVVGTLFTSRSTSWIGPSGAVPAAAALSTSNWHGSLRVQPLEEPLGALARKLRHGARRAAKGFVATVSKAARTWGGYAKRALIFILLAVAFALSDRKLLAAWREKGLEVLVSYVPLMLYVYVRLLFDRRVHFGAKALLVGALVYAMIRADLVPDRNVVPGLIDDILLIALAIRFLLAWCTDEVVYAHAAGAINWRRRVWALNRSRRR